jgi:NAD(P)-dependent dehydrogenase (short-subunit alcohol dehydrogenase family)
MPGSAPDSPVVVVTGAAGNVGRATVVLLAERDVHVVAVDHHETAVRGILDSLAAPGRHLAVGDVDLTDPAACDRVIALAVERFGRVDGLATTVGGFAAAPVVDSGPELWERMFRLNVITTLNVFRAAIAPMRLRRHGSLVAVGAGAALRAPAGLAAYAAAKSAVLRLTESVADEVKADGIRVNAILPGTIDTPPNRAAMPTTDHAAWVTPHEIAEVIAFLLADASSGITGALLPVTGRS